MSVKISELNAVETLEIEDVVPIVNVSSGVTEKATIAQIVAFAAGDGNALLIQGVPVSATPPIHGEVIVFDEDAGEWGPGTGIPVPNAPGDVFISDDGLTGTWRPLTEDDIGDGFVVTMAGTQTVEIGATVATPNFTAVYTGGAATAATLTDNDGSAPKVLTLPATSFESDEDFTKTANNASVTFTITAAKGAVVDTSSVTITWLPLVYYGVEVPAAYTEAFIEALATSALDANVARSFAVNAGPTEHVYFAAPSSYGTPDFKVGGFAMAIDMVATVSVTNTHGVTQNYDLWESTFPGLGSITVVVT
jgi:hypothetical protein